MSRSKAVNVLSDDMTDAAPLIRMTKQRRKYWLYAYSFVFHFPFWSNTSLIRAATFRRRASSCSTPTSDIPSGMPLLSMQKPGKLMDGTCKAFVEGRMRYHDQLKATTCPLCPLRIRTDHKHGSSGSPTALLSIGAG